MAFNAPGKHFRAGITLMQLADMFPDEQAAIKWFEAIRWPTERHCGHCGSTATKPVPSAKPMPYWCTSCRSYFSVRTGTTIQKSRLPLRKWAFAVYLYVTNIKGVSSMKLHRDLGVTQKTAWYMLHRLREAWGKSGLEQFIGPVEVDETYIGGKRKNMSIAKRATWSGRGAVGKTAVVGVKDRDTGKVTALPVESVNRETLQDFVAGHADDDAKVYTDEAAAYRGLPFDHETVNHSVSEYVRGQAHTNGIESFWALLKRGYQGTYHHMSPKHLARYVAEFSGRHNVRPQNTIDQMSDVVAAMKGKPLPYRDLISG